ncbi:MAG: zinc ribbon domain-containing protein, partial [Clostridia bacterium]|nr:zinc ribbon domain-containing protein [Clostridia bacterium]
MKPCPKCGEQIKDTLKFCVYCGCNIAQEEEKNKTKFCGECGAELVEGMKFCGECGAKVGAPAQNDDPWADVMAEEKSDDPWSGFADSVKETTQPDETDSSKSLDVDMSFLDDPDFQDELRHEIGKSSQWADECYKNGMAERDAGNFAQALNWFEKGADEEDGRCMNEIGWLYQNGWGVKQDYAKAMHWYKQGDLHGYAIATNNIGWLYQNGWGVKQDYKKAFEYYMSASV